MIAAVMTQPMRAKYLAAYVREAAVLDAVTIFIGSTDALDGQDLPSSVSVVSSEPATPLSRTPNVVRRWQSSLRRWVTSGVGRAPIVHRTLRKLSLIAGDVARASKRHRASGGEDADMVDRALVSRLAVAHEDEAISAIAVFDAYDLPSVRAFARTHDVQVLVR